MTVQEMVKTALNIEELPPIVIMDIERVGGKVKNFCNISEIPEALHFTVADMVVDLNKQRTDDVDIKVTSVKMGDTSYSFQADSAVDKMIKNYESELIDFRKMRW